MEIDQFIKNIFPQNINFHPNLNLNSGFISHFFSIEKKIFDKYQNDFDYYINKEIENVFVDKVQSEIRLSDNLVYLNAIDGIGSVISSIIQMSNRNYMMSHSLFTKIEEWIYRTKTVKYSPFEWSRNSPLQSHRIISYGPFFGSFCYGDVCIDSFEIFAFDSIRYNFQPIQFIENFKDREYKISLSVKVNNPIIFKVLITKDCQEYKDYVSLLRQEKINDIIS